MIALLFSRQGAWLAGAMAVVGLLTFSHLKAYQAGRNVERTAALQASIHVLREKAGTDAQIRNMDDASLCTALGGSVLPDGSCG